MIFDTARGQATVQAGLGGVPEIVDGALREETCKAMSLRLGRWLSEVNCRLEI